MKKCNHLLWGVSCCLFLINCQDNDPPGKIYGNNNKRGECNNNKLESGEICDGIDLGTKDCTSLGYVGGTLKCNLTCNDFDTTQCTMCGNGKVDSDEACDGLALGNQTCRDFGYTNGELKCEADCRKYDAADCSGICKNKSLDPGEICDKAEDGSDLLGNHTCISEGFTSGTLRCSETCELIKTGCYPQGDCGNGEIDGGEKCDLENFSGKTCRDFGYTGGVLKCEDDCDDIDTTGCSTETVCSDNKAEGPEKCDGEDLKDQNCISQGFLGGTLSCLNDCSNFDKSLCHNCGNNELDTNEICDGKELAGNTCRDFNFKTGQLACDKNCKKFDVSGCQEPSECNNGIKESLEVCDGTDFGNHTCITLRYQDGLLACKDDCTDFDTSQCIGEPSPFCGDSVINGLELCDDNDWRVGPACSAFGMGTEQEYATCSDDCAPDLSNCSVDFCKRKNWYDDGICDACELMGGTVDSDCSYYCGYNDDWCPEYYDTFFDLYTCREYYGIDDPDCGLCGDGVIQIPSEICDKQDLQDLQCIDFGFIGGILACHDDCSFDLSKCIPPICGDGLAQGYEICDGSDLKDTTCRDQGFASGTLTCLDNCEGFSTAQCVSAICNGTELEPGEICDGSNLGDYSCKKLGLKNGTLHCANDCLGYNIDSCGGPITPTTCNNDLIDGLEYCEGDDLYFDISPYCSDYDLGNGYVGCRDCLLDFSECAQSDFCAVKNFYNDGEYCDSCDLLGGSVDPDCIELCTQKDGWCYDWFDVTTNAWTCRHLGLVDPDCGTCGNNRIDGGEHCDGSRFAGDVTCSDFVYVGGELKCTTDCSLDFSACSLPAICNNGILETNELCDTNQLGEHSCKSLGFSGGDLHCQVDCQGFDVSQCTQSCGNSIQEGTEACDDEALNNQSCQDFGFAQGQLRCANDCKTFDLSACSGGLSPCGDGLVNGLEMCDANQWYLLGPECGDFNLGSGLTICSDNCQIDFSNCQEQDYCQINGWYNDSFCDACDLLGGVVDPDCLTFCVADGFCTNYFDTWSRVWTCGHLGLQDADCGECGNNKIEGFEMCDQSDHGSMKDCQSYGFSGGGNLRCQNEDSSGGDCLPDFSNCIN